MEQYNKKQAKYLLEHLNKSKDETMKELEEDIRFVTWVAWGVGLIFPEKSPIEMFEYMKNPNFEQLDKMFENAEKNIRDFSNKGFDLDFLKIVKNELYEISGYLNIENQIKYEEHEIRTRAFFYLSSILFRFNNLFKKQGDKFSDFHEAISVWIFPTRLTNTVETHKYEDTYTINDGKTFQIDFRELKGDIDLFTSYFFFLGDPNEILFSKKLPEEILKQRILLYLFDVLFNLSIPVNDKLNYLKKFNFESNKIEREIEMSTKLSEEMNWFFETYVEPTIDTFKQMEKERNEYKMDILALKEKNKEKDKTIEAARKENEEKDKRIRELEENIKILKKL